MGSAGASTPDPAQRERREGHHRDLDGVVRPGSASPCRRSISTSRRSTSAPYREGCLVSMSSRTGAAALAQRLQQPVQGEQPGVLASCGSLGRRAAGMPGAEVERVQLGQRLRADPAACRCWCG